MQFTVDHIESLSFPDLLDRNDLTKYSDVTKRERPKIFISDVLLESPYVDDDVIMDNKLSVIKEVNGTLVNTVDEFKHIIENLMNNEDIKSKVVHIKLASGRSIVISI